MTWADPEVLRSPLLPHPTTPAAALHGVEARVTVGRCGELGLRWLIQGDIGALQLPPPAPTPGPRDGLWRHTCCEVFIAQADVGTEPGSVGPYVEWNFSPSGDWAVYEFDSWRAGQRDASARLPAPAIATRADAASFELAAMLSVPRAASSLAPALFRIGLSVVLEERDGALSYWALRHAPGKPDFHAAAAFAATVEMPAPLPAAAGAGAAALR